MAELGQVGQHRNLQRGDETLILGNAGAGLGEDDVGAGILSRDGTFDRRIDAFDRQCIQVRATIMNWSSMRPSVAALMRSKSPRSPRQPCLGDAALGLDLISMSQAAAPARMNSLTVRWMLNTAPQPVSASTSSGNAVAPLMRRMSRRHCRGWSCPGPASHNWHWRCRRRRRTARLETGNTASGLHRRKGIDGAGQCRSGWRAWRCACGRKRNGGTWLLSVQRRRLG